MSATVNPRINIPTGLQLEILSGNATYVLRLTSTGLKIMSSAGTLKGYAEGETTPTIEGDGTVGDHDYTTQYGRWVRIGQDVDIDFLIAISAKNARGSAMAGNIQIANLMPYPSANVTARSAVAWGDLNHIDWGSGMLAGRVDANSSLVKLSKLVAGTAAVSARVDETEIGNTLVLAGHLSYQTTAAF